MVENTMRRVAVVDVAVEVAYAEVAAHKFHQGLHSWTTGSATRVYNSFL